VEVEDTYENVDICPRCGSSMKEIVYSQRRWDNVKQTWYVTNPSKVYCDKCGYEQWIPDNIGFPVS